MEGDHADARVAERRRDGEPEVHEQDGELDEVDGAVVRALDGERDLVRVRVRESLIPSVGARLTLMMLYMLSRLSVDMACPMLLALPRRSSAK